MTQNLIFPGSTYTCIAIALERYLGICHGQSDFVIRKSRYYICAILLLALLVDSPRLVEISYKPGNETANTTLSFGYSDVRKDQTYITVYTLWIRLIVTAALPFILLMFFNLGILVYYKKNR